MVKKLIDKQEYGWAVCAAVASMLFCTSALGSTGFSVYQPYLIKLRGLTNVQSSTMLTVRSLFTMFGMLAANKCIERVGVRRVIAGAMVLEAAGAFVYAFIGSYYGVCAGAAICGLAFGAGGMIPASILINRWFHKDIGLALGICMASTGAAAMITAPVITYMVEAYSLRVSFFAEGVFILIVAVIVYQIVYSRPECLNTVAVGDGKKISKTAAAHASENSPNHMMIPMMTGILIFGMSANSLCPHISVLYSGEGFGSNQVSLLLSLMGFFLAAGKCAFGWILDRIGMLRASILLYGMTVAGIILCTFAGNGSFVIAVAAVILLSFGLAVVSVSLSIYAAHVSTAEEYSHTIQHFQLLNACGGLIFGRVPGMIADSTGSYVPAFGLMMVLCIVGASITTLVYHNILLKERKSKVLSA